MFFFIESHEENTICKEEEMKNLCNIEEEMTDTSMFQSLPH